MLRRRILPATLLTAAVAAVTVAATAPPAGAADLPVSQSRGFFLSGTVGGTDIAQAADLPTTGGNPLTGASAVNTGGPTVTEANPQGLGDLGGLGIPLPSGSTLPIGQGLQFGVLNQYATANPDGSAASSSGAIADNGTLQVGGAAGGTAGTATLDLAQLGSALTSALPAALQDLGDVSLTAGALAARADQDPFDPAGTPGGQRGSYRIGSLVLQVAAPALLTDQLQALLATFSTASTALQQALTTALQALPGAGQAASVEITGLPDPATLFDGLTTVSVDGVTVDFAAGTISIDLVALIQAVTGKDVNALPPNTDLLALLQQALAGADIARAVADAVQAAVEQGRQQLVDALGTATATITLAGVPIAVSGGTLLTLLNLGTPAELPGVTALTDAVAALTGGLQGAFGSLLGTLGSGLGQLLGLVANRQVNADGAFTETALALTLLPGGLPGSPLGGALLDLGLGNASVGPGAPLPVVTSTPPAPTPVSAVATLANTGPFETLGGIAAGTWAVVAGAALLLATGAIVSSRRWHRPAHR